MGTCLKCGGYGALFMVNEAGFCSSCYKEQDEGRDQLEVLGKLNMRLRAFGSSLIVSEKRKETTIPITSIQDFAIKVPKGTSSGTITISTAKAPDGFLGIGFGMAIGAPTEKTIVLLENSEMVYAKNIQKYISDYMSGESSVGMSPSSADEIMKYKGLLDAGAITESEYEAKKKQLLGIS